MPPNKNNIVHLKPSGSGCGENGPAILEQIIGSMDECLVVLNNDAEVSFVNGSALRILGYEAGEILGMPFGGFVNDENLEFFKAVREIITHGPLKDFRLRLVSKSGEAVPASVNGTALRDERTGELSGVLLVARDIRRLLRLLEELERANRDLEKKVEERTGELKRAYSELKSAQATLLQNEKMASIGQLAAGVAHEINNPMGFLISNLSAIERCIRDFSDFAERFDDAAARPGGGVGEVAEFKRASGVDLSLKDALEAIGESKDGAERVKSIVSALRDFSCVDCGEVSVFDVNAGLESVLNTVASELKGVRVIRDYGDVPFVRAFGGELNQAFMNVIVNAADAVSENGEIRIATRVSDGLIFVEISDNGRGIRDEELPRVFEPFFTTKPVGKGTGLGLSMTYNIVKRHGGEIAVKSTQGSGAVFTITLKAGI